MSFTIFYAWQMDTDMKLNRWFIEGAIKDAIKQLKREVKQEAIKLDIAPAVDTSEANVTNPEPDQDDHDIVFQWGAMGGTGATLIAETILSRIENCDVFVGDVSFVAKMMTGDDRTKYQPNSNVLIETGAATRTGQRWDRMVLVMNKGTSIGKVEDLPFDLRHRLCTVQYDLSSWDDPDRNKKRKVLVQDIVDQIGPMYRKASSETAKRAEEVQGEQVRAARERGEQEWTGFEQKLNVNGFYEFKARFGLMAFSIMPVMAPINGVLNLSDETSLTRYFQPPDTSGCTVRHRPKSVTTSGYQAKGVSRCLIEVTSGGYVYFARNLAYGRDDPESMVPTEWKIDGTKDWLIPMASFQPQLIDSVRSYLQGLKEMGVNGPWLFRLAMLKMNKGLLVPSTEWHWISEMGEVFNGEKMSAEPVVVPADQDLTSSEAIEATIRPALDEIWRHNAYRGAPTFDKNGHPRWPAR